MFRNMVTSLFKHDRIRTTDKKAKELRGWADHLITLAKRGDLHARRQALSIIREKKVVHKLFEEAPKRFSAISGGYTRIVKLGHRPGDAAPVSLIELLAADKKSKKKTEDKKEEKIEKAAEPMAIAEKEPDETSAAAPASDAPKDQEASQDEATDRPEA